MARSLSPAVTEAAPRRLSRHERRRLAEADRRTAQLAELDRIAGLLSAAGAIVARGWLQCGWYRYAGPDGALRTATTRPAGRGEQEELAGAWLVGAILQAGGGPGEAHSQLVQRTLDVIWHAAFADPGQPVRWCPPPAERAIRIHELIGWNDRPGRTRAEVVELIETARCAAGAEQVRLRGGGGPGPPHNPARRFVSLR